MSLNANFGRVEASKVSICQIEGKKSVNFGKDFSYPNVEINNRTIKITSFNENTDVIFVNGVNVSYAVHRELEAVRKIGF